MSLSSDRSLVASCPDPDRVPKMFTEDDSNELVERLGKEAIGADKYSASKMLPEKSELRCSFVCGD